MKSSTLWGGGSGVATVSRILRHRGVQLILAYSWPRPTVLVVGNSRGGIVLLCPRHFQLGEKWVGGGGRGVRNIVSPLSVEKICVLDSYFIHIYIIIKCRPSSI